MTLPIQELQNRLWATADQLRANSELTSAEYKSPVLGLVFLRFVDQKFQAASQHRRPRLTQPPLPHGIPLTGYNGGRFPGD